MEETCRLDDDDSRCQQVNNLKRKLAAQQCFLPKCLKKGRRKEKKKSKATWKRRNKSVEMIS